MLLNYSFAPDKTLRFVFSMHKSIRKTFYYTAKNFGSLQLLINCFKVRVALSVLTLTVDNVNMVNSFFNSGHAALTARK